jgi:hypothetical protein
MASKFSEFIAKQKLDPRRILAASRSLERLRPEDRSLRQQKKKASGSDSAPSAEEGKPEAPPKPRSGRPVTRVLLSAATSGTKVSGPAKTRLLRAVNHLLSQKKQDPVEFKTLF